MSKVQLHLWCLGKDLACLVSFSQDASNEEKEAVFIAIHREPLPEDIPCLAPNRIERFADLSVVQFVTSCSLNLFLASPINP